MRLVAATLFIAWYCLSNVQSDEDYDLELPDSRSDPSVRAKSCYRNGGQCMGPWYQHKCKSPKVLSDEYKCRRNFKRCCIEEAESTTTTEVPGETVCEDEIQFCDELLQYMPDLCEDPTTSSQCQKTCKIGPCAETACENEIQLCDELLQYMPDLCEDPATSSQCQKTCKIGPCAAEPTNTTTTTTTRAPEPYLPTTSPNHTLGDPYVKWVPLNPSTPLQEEAYDLLKVLDWEASKIDEEMAFASWKYQTDLTEENNKKQLEAALMGAAWEKEAWNKVMKYKDQWKEFPDKNLRRLYKEWVKLGSAALDPEDLKKMNNYSSSMQATYSKATICDFHDKSKCNIRLNPDLENLMAESEDYEELSHVWKSWRDVSGKKIRKRYGCFVKLLNKQAKLNGYKNMGEMWRDEYEDENFQDDVERLLDQIKPLYKQLHAYTRRKFREIYGEDKIGPKSPIPAHITGNMWAQYSHYKYHLLEPYPGKDSIDVTDAMIEQNYTVKGMFELADSFFTSLNLYPMPKEFWDGTVMVKPADKEMVCHASAWDFGNHKDFRIKQCTDINMRDLMTVHHEMGHIQYDLHYSHQPEKYRSGANPGFHEAIGDVIELSVSTPEHLHEIGLLKNIETDYETDINFLMRTALKSINLLPFAYIMDNWRWDVFSGAVKQENWNCHWWKYRTEVQGIKPPVKRSEEDFDPGAKYHIPSNTAYIRYFVALISKFQFQKALCLKANEYDPNDPSKPLHRCDIYKSAEAGAALKEMLEMGGSKPWPEAMEKITGTDRMDASVIREYFKPLEDWLKKDNAANNEYIGWETGTDGEYCS